MTAYLDHAATTPVLPAAARALADQLAAAGNPSSLHASGRAARRVVEESRERLAAVLGARPSEVVWTSGGTEADNLAVKGLAWARRAEDPRRDVVLVSAVEHHAVLDPAAWLGAHDGALVVHLPVDDEGTVRLDALADALDTYGPRVALVSVMLANNEVGTLQPVPDVVALAHARGVPVHSDAVQALGQVPVRFDALGVDALTVTSHKIGGPGGVGALVVGRSTALEPVLHGGGQERGVRSGTLDAALVRGFAVAADEAV
ncbi:cysteine desulfurase family protein, partial [Cellulomonas massiliensis]|uniref:cysteine desulfurase family protein n=1 Tax=Cellulomonas massiliensis TaxID=1465811 RepID=UPI00036BA77A